MRPPASMIWPQLLQRQRIPRRLRASIENIGTNRTTRATVEGDRRG